MSQKPTRLTDIAIQHLKPRDKRYEFPDAQCRGLYVQVTPTGAKSFTVRGRINGKPAKLLTMPIAAGLASARREATDVLAKVARGDDPRVAKKAAKAVATDTVESVSRRYMQIEGHKLRTARWRERAFERLIYPTIGSRPVAEIKRSEVARLLDDVEINNGAAMSNGVYHYFGRFIQAACSHISICGSAGIASAAFER
jgi:hypothetical protein